MKRIQTFNCNDSELLKNTLLQLVGNLLTDVHIEFHTSTLISNHVDILMYRGKPTDESFIRGFVIGWQAKGA